VLPPASSSGSLTALSSTPLPPPVPLAPAPAPAAKPAPAASGTGDFRVQIAATRDEPTARTEWERLKKAHLDLLGTFTPTIVKADLGDKGVFYRVQAGPIATHDQADKLCGALKQFAIACLIVKP
jgi:cell division septation protein DedD